MKKYIALLAVALIGMCMFSACGNEQVANPVNECDKSEMLDATGIDIDAPEGAKAVVYSYIDTDDTVAQVTFSLDGKDYCYRAKFVDDTSIKNDVDGNTLKDMALLESIANQSNIGAALSGMNYEWKASGMADVMGRDSVFGFNKNKEGFIAWLDVAPGVLYSISADNGCNQEMLQSIADKCFVPLQGEV